MGLSDQHSSGDSAKTEPRFVPLATVPLQDGARRRGTPKEPMAMGFKGVMIGTQPKARRRPGRSLAPSVLEAADELGSIVFVHPVFESGDDRVHDYGMANAVGRITDTLIAMSRLIYAGHVTRYARWKSWPISARAALPYVIGRQRRNYSLDNKLGDPDAALGGDVLRHHRAGSAHAPLLADIVGADRIMMGSDMPFPIGDLAPSRSSQETKFSEAERKAASMAGWRGTVRTWVTVSETRYRRRRGQIPARSMRCGGRSTIPRC